MAISEYNDPVAVGVRMIIAKKGLRQNAVAKRARLSEQQLSDMLNGRKLIKACDLLPIAEALGVTVDELLAAGRDNT